MSQSSAEHKPVTVTIDGISVTTDRKTTILEAAKAAGVDIPTLCYHPRLSPIGSCRVCLVKVEGIDEPVTACDNPVSDGMIVTTSDDELERLRRQNIQFILLNHPLECPVCDKAYECDLQDITYKLEVHGQDYDMSEVTWENDTASSLIFRSDGRCIRCGRCVAICAEVQNVKALDFDGKGYDASIAPTTGETLDCEFCGQCVSICPVGALINKHFLHKIRVWDLEKTDTVCAFCGAGCELSAQTLNGDLYRVMSGRNGHNQGDLCSRGTFGFDFVKAGGRVTGAKVDGEDADIDQAIKHAAVRLSKIVDGHGPEAVAGIGSARMTNEEAFGFAQFISQTVGSPNLDTEAGFGYRMMLDRTFGRPKGTFNDVEECDAVLLLGSDLAVEMPVPALRVIRASKFNDAKVVAAAPYDTKLHKVATSPMIYNPGSENAYTLALVAAAIEHKLVPEDITKKPDFEKGVKEAGYNLDELCDAAGVEKGDVIEAATALFSANKLAVIVGPYGYRDCISRGPAALLANLLNPDVFLLSADRANMQGVVGAGCAPGENGKSYTQVISGIEEGSIKALWVAGSDAATIFAGRAELLSRLELLVVQSAFENGTTAKAHVLLSSTLWGAKKGTYTSAEGRTQMLGAPLKGEDPSSDFEIFAKAADVFGKGIAPSADFVPGMLDAPAKEGELKFTKPNFVKKPEGNPYLAVRGSSLFMNGYLGSLSENLKQVCSEAYVAANTETVEKIGAEPGAKVTVKTDFGKCELALQVDNRLPDGVLLVIDNFPNSGAAALFDRPYSFSAASVE